MQSRQIQAGVPLGRIAFSQDWEDPQILATALGQVSATTLLSACGAGDGALSLLLLDPAKVHVIATSPAQLYALQLRIGAYQALDHDAFLELMGARASDRRDALLTTALTAASPQANAFWNQLAPAVVAHGAGFVGTREAALRRLTRYALPLALSGATRRTLFARFKDDAARKAFVADRLNTARWRMVLRKSALPLALGAIAPQGDTLPGAARAMAELIASRIPRAANAAPPAQNPALHWLMTGDYGAALPRAWRADSFDTIAARLDRIIPHTGPVQGLALKDVAGFNLSLFFETLRPADAGAAYGSFLNMAAPGARLVYWNMLTPRRCPGEYRLRIERLEKLENQLKAADRGFLYSDLVVEQAI